MKYIILFAAVYLSFTIGLEFDRPCRNDVGAKENFRTSFYEGIWFELYNSVNQTNVECIDHRYTQRGINQFDVERIGTLNNGFVRETAVVRVAFPNEVPIRAILNGTINRITGEVIEYNYRIHATDYTNYAILWSCTNLPNNRSVEEGSILGRQTDLSEKVYTTVDGILAQVNLFRRDFRFINHTIEACLLA